MLQLRLRKYEKGSDLQRNIPPQIVFFRISLHEVEVRNDFLLCIVYQMI
jgi:hypothetical protein